MPSQAGRSYSQTLAALAAAQKSPKGAPAYSRYVNRPLGRYLAAAGYQLGLAPNHITAISAMFSFGGIAVLALARPSVLVALIVALCLVIGYAFDAADGQLARLRGGGSPAGEWLDHMVDAVKISSLHLAVLISFFRFFDLSHQVWLLVPLGYCVVAAVMFFGMTLVDQLRRNLAARTGIAPVRTQPSDLRSLLVIPTDYGLLCVVFVLLAVPDVFRWVYLALFVCNAGFLALAALKWFSEMNNVSTAKGGQL